VVTAPAGDHRALHPVVEIGTTEIESRAPVTLTELLTGLPSLGIRINSRGEAVLRLRGSEERQTAIFLDGAPLSVPWDGRVDLSALPAGIVDSVQVRPSAAPIEYGPNAVLGVVDIRTPASVAPGLQGVRVAVGTQNRRSFDGTAGVRTGDIDWLFGVGYRHVGGEAVSDRSVIPFGRVDDGERVNTDLERASLFVAAGSEFERGAVWLSLLSVDAERAIANAGHIDPARGSPRYWRYPRWRFDQLTLNAGLEPAARTELRTTAWLQHFEQTIDQYRDDSYTALDGTQEDRDRTFGVRMVVEHRAGDFAFRWVGAGQQTRHEQVESEYAPRRELPQVRYQQNLYSVGVEADVAIGRDIEVSAAVSHDRAATPLTGGRDSQENLSAWAASVAGQLDAGAHWDVTATLGQRTRFPSLRELYGQALGQFVVNPGLRPETALLGDVTLQRSYLAGALEVRLTPWWLRVDDTLSRRRVVIDGELKRERFNLRGSRGYGIEAGLDWLVNEALTLRSHVSLQDLEARGSEPSVLYQRPERQAALSIDWSISRDWSLFAEVRHVGGSVDLDEDGGPQPLPDSTLADFRLFRTVSRGKEGRWRLYASIDNVTDELVLPQLGFPLPGRSASVGITFERKETN